MAPTRTQDGHKEEEVVVGTPGIADSESPVILVNETTGRTA